MLGNGTLATKKISLAGCTNDQGQLRFQGALDVPDYTPLQLEILNLHHTTVYQPLTTWAGLRPSSSSAESSTGLRCASMSNNTYTTAALAAKRSPFNTPPSATSSVSRYPSAPGRRSQWTLSPGSPTVRGSIPSL